MNNIIYKRPDQIRVVAVLGTGSVGASWIALFLAHGLEVIAYDPSPHASESVNEFVSNAWPALRELGRTRLLRPPLDLIRFVSSAGEAARMADLVQENCPEHLEVKKKLLAEVEAVAVPSKIILSSTGGIPPSAMQEACTYPERLVLKWWADGKLLRLWLIGQWISPVPCTNNRFVCTLKPMAIWLIVCSLH